MHPAGTVRVSSTPSVADLVDALIEAGADPNCRNSVDWGPLLVSSTVVLSRRSSYGEREEKHRPSNERAGGGLRFSSSLLLLLPTGMLVANR